MKHLFFFCVIFFGQSAVILSQALPDSVEAAIESEQIYLIDYAVDLIESESETLRVACLGTDCYLIWQDKVIATQWSYENAGNLMSRMSALGCSDIFLMQVYNGDACPNAYRILDLSIRSKPTLSEEFGNCEEIDAILIEYPHLKFYFKENEIAQRSEMAYEYDRRTLVLKKTN